MNSVHYQEYFNRILDSFPHPQTDINQSCFIDSWEVKSKKLKFPLRYGQSYAVDTITRNIIVHYQNQDYELELSFQPNQSKLIRIHNGNVYDITPGFKPKEPEIKGHLNPENMKWLVE